MPYLLGREHILVCQDSLLTTFNLHRNEPNWLRDFAKKHGLEIIGVGTTTAVFSHPSHNDVVVGIEHQPKRVRDRLKSGEIFIVHRILKLLFPSNFPSMYSVLNCKERSASIRQKIHHGPTIIADTSISELDSGSRYPFCEVRKKLGYLGLPIYFDNYERNFGLADDGGVYYLDVAEIVYSLINSLDTDSLVRKCKELGYNDRVTKLVEKNVIRLKQLLATGTTVLS